MTETPATPPAPENDTSAVVASEPGKVSQWLTEQGFEHAVLDPDHVGVEQIGVDAPMLPILSAALKAHGFDYLQVQGGYDEGPGKQLVCFYHFLAMAEQVAAMEAGETPTLREVRVKVSLSREGTPTIPSMRSTHPTFPTRCGLTMLATVHIIVD